MRYNLLCYSKAVSVTKEFLHVVRGLREKVSRERERLEKLKDYRARLTQELTGMPHSDNAQSRLENLTIAIMDCEATIEKLNLIRIQCCSEMCAEIGQQITDVDQQAVLVERYVFGEKFSEIGKKLGFSEQHTYRLHKSAIKTLNKT